MYLCTLTHVSMGRCFVDISESPKNVTSLPVPISDTERNRVPGASSPDPSVESKTSDSKEQPDITGSGVTGHATTLLDLLWLGVTDPPGQDQSS